MICKKCGENLPNNARECFTCGAKVRRAVAVEPDVKTAPKSAVGVVKPPRPSGEVLKEVFSSGSYLILCVLLMIHTVVSLGSIIFTFSFSELDIVDTISNTVNIVMQLILIVPALSLYVKAKAVKEPTGDSFIKLFRILHIYMIANLVVSIINSVTSFIAMAALSLFSIQAVIVEVVALVLGILPVYAAYQLTGSLIKSCELGRMRLEGVKVLRVYVIIYSVLFIALTAIMLLAFIIIEGAPMALIFILLMLCYAVLMLRIHNFLYLLQDKSKY